MHSTAVTATKMPSAVRKTTTPETLTSVPSYPSEASTSTGSCSLCCSKGELCDGMFGLQNLRQMRIVGRDQRTRLQIAAIDSYPQRNHGYRHRRVLQNSPAEMQVPRCVLEVRLNQPEQIEELGKDHPLANPRQPFFVPLDVPRQQQRERNQPMEEEVQGADYAPVAVDAVQIPGNLFR